jgi:hypothetical protein
VYLKYFKNKELTTLYNVSDKTVRNWIAASQEGKLGLKLIEEKGRTYIADSVANNYLLEQMAVSGKKYRNSRNHKTIEPTAEFYRLFDSKQVIDIANSLDNYHELSWHYSYFGIAAPYWNQYLHELYDAGKPNLITNTIETLDLSVPYIDAIIADYKYVNVVNVCIGSNLTVKKVITRMQEQNKLKRFIAIDISPGILDAAEIDTNTWYEGSVKMEKHVLDIRSQNFNNILAEDSFGVDASQTINLVFFIAGPLHNFKDPRHVLRMLNNSIGKNDLLFTSVKRNTVETKRFFDFNIKSDRSMLGMRRKMLLDLLNIDKSFYEVEQSVDVEENVSFVRVRLRVSLSILFEKDKFKNTVELQKGDTLTLWRGWKYTDAELVELFSSTDFIPIQVIHSLDGQLTMQISKINTEERTRLH